MMPVSIVFVLMGSIILLTLLAVAMFVLIGFDIAWDIWEKRFGKGKR